MKHVNRQNTSIDKAKDNMEKNTLRQNRHTRDLRRVADDREHNFNFSYQTL
jgi:hypothetical protein